MASKMLDLPLPLRPVIELNDSSLRDQSAHRDYSPARKTQFAIRGFYHADSTESEAHTILKSLFVPRMT
jgi:hypothetical protein